MNTISLFGSKIAHRVLYSFCIVRFSSDRSFGTFNASDDDETLKRIWRNGDFGGFGVNHPASNYEEFSEEHFSLRQNFTKNARVDAQRVLGILRQDGLGFDAKAELSALKLRISGPLVRHVLVGILSTINLENKTRCAKLGYKFFVWSGQQENYKHTVNTYHLILKIFAECEEFKAMWRMVDEMTGHGFATTARTFNLLICACGEAGLARKVVEMFIKTKTFNYRPFKHSYNAILHSLVGINQYKLIEWVYEQMMLDGHPPDVMTYNIVMIAAHRQGKFDQFHRLLDEMSQKGFSPDFHTYNILLHVLGKGDKPLAALNLLNYMKEVGVYPNLLHFTTLIDGLSRAGNLDASKYFFGEMVQNGCFPDVVCYTVMITGFIAAGQLEDAQLMFNEMIHKGQLPNVFTYNSMIRGLCMAGKFEEACSMLKEMKSRGVSPNYFVYSTLVSSLQNAGKLSEAHKIMKLMVKEGQYVHLLPKIKSYRRC